MRQLWVHERTSVLYYTYIAGFVNTIYVNTTNKWSVNTDVYRKENQHLISPILLTITALYGSK
jgi:hypothetical protein